MVERRQVQGGAGDGVAERGQRRSEYCRRKGIYPEQIRQWREACEQANVAPEVKLNGGPAQWK